MENVRILRKSDAEPTLEEGGALSNEQEKAFFRLTLNAAEIMKPEKNVIDVKQFSGNELDLDTIAFASRILSVPANTISKVDAVAPRFGRRTLSAVRTMFTVAIPYTLLEDNIEGERIEDTIMEQAAIAWGNDILDLATNGDGETEGFLSIDKGWVQIIKDNASGSHVFDTEGETDFNGVIFPGMLAELPEKWQADRKKLVFLVSPVDYRTYEDQIKALGTPLGDRVIMEGLNLPWKGIAVEIDPYLPTGTLLLTLRKNLVIGVKRGMTIGIDDSRREDTKWMTITSRVGIDIRVLDAVCLAYKVS